ncbi:MAG: transposase family protein [Gammaproteobacteria bacterium]|nr:transposase family protein [Gammaproteobacteria bacterium]
MAGCIDGTLIPIIRPSLHEDQFVDRKGEHSLNAMMVCGPEMQILYCNVDRPGAANDARVLRTSGLHQDHYS